MFVPFLIFILLNLFWFFRSKEKNWLRLVYWLLSGTWLAITTVVEFRFIATMGFSIMSVIPTIMGALYGISLFVVWWWRPDFYYSWNQGRRPKVKKN